MTDRHAGRLAYWVPFAVLTLLAHLLLAWGVDRALPWLTPPPPEDPAPVSLVVLEPTERDEDEEEPEEEQDDDPEGQIVETAKPKEPERPEEAEYLAEHDTTVDEETRSELFKINPEVVAPEYSDDEKMEHEDRVDVNVDRPSTGARTGNDRFDPDRDGSMAALPSPWTLTNKKGLEDPVPASHRAATLAGAPQNDLLDEEVGPQTQLNTKEVLYASYLLRIRRLVNFYWEQNLRNLPRSTRIAKPRYTTGVMVVLNGDGALEDVGISESAGVAELDDAVVRAYRLAGPFPNPPEKLVDPDGYVRLPLMTWTVTFRAARNQYQGVDPNAGKRFPGLLKSPR